MRNDVLKKHKSPLRELPPVLCDMCRQRKMRELCRQIPIGKYRYRWVCHTCLGEPGNDIGTADDRPSSDIRGVAASPPPGPPAGAVC